MISELLELLEPSRALTDNDIGKVFIIEIDKYPMDQIGQYKVLKSTYRRNTAYMANFYSFDVVDDEIIGKMRSTNDAALNYIEVKCPDYIKHLGIQASKECIQSVDRLFEDFEVKEKKRQGQFRLMYGKTENWTFFDEGKADDYAFIVWIIWNEKSICVEFYKDDTLIKNERFAWSHEPIFGVSYEDRQKLWGENGIVYNLKDV